MKYNKIISFAAAAVLLCSCADNDMFSQAPQEPGITGQYDYLNGYNKLKTYVDRNANPNFKLGTGVEAANYLGHKMAWTVTNENFDELTPGNAMKFASVVKDDGTMDFSTVKDLVNKSAEAGLTVYGHTLCWHSQQNMTYLKSLLAPPNYFLHVTSTSSGKNAWDASITYQLSNPLTVDKTYVITFKGKINVQAWTSKDPVQLYFWPSCEKGTQYLPGFQLTKNWDQVSLEFKASQPIEKLNFEFGFLTGDFCIDDISLVEKGTDKNLILNSDFEDDNVNSWTFPSWLKQLSIIRDKEESTNSGGEEAAKDSLNKVLDKWIGGMMTACDGKVKAFDAVNEPMSDNVPTELKTGTAGRDGSTKTNFFWQDYLGKDYARTVVALARKYGPSDLKLFINDYGLESAYKNNAKCQGLIDMIKYWESDGVTKIDGIGTQMHVTCSLNPTTQKQNEDAVVNQFKLLAATGKLIKISELDMGLADAAGKTLITDSVNTEEEQNAQKAYYDFIIKAYFDNIPVAQRYGITLWSQTDSPAGSGWRPNEPIGLWDKNYVRKPAYAGFADGLAGK
jgi:GH35 family endo-1,4-beta-xylanase